MPDTIDLYERFTLKYLYVMEEAEMNWLKVFLLLPSAEGH